MSKKYIEVDGVKFAPYLDPKMNKMEELQRKRKLLLDQLKAIEKPIRESVLDGTLCKQIREVEQSPASDDEIGSTKDNASSDDNEQMEEGQLDESTNDSMLDEAKSESTLHDENGDISMEKLEKELESKIEKPLYKTVLESMETDHFESLPAGWTRVTHNSGMPVYLHRESRVVSFSRPYYIGPDSVRHHSVPISAIPCLQQRKINERQKEKTELPENSNLCPLIKNIQSSGITIEKFEDSRAAAPEITKYASAIFKFKQIPLQVRKYQSFKEKKLERHTLKTEKTLRDAGVSSQDINFDAISTTTNSGVALINIKTLDNRFHKKNFVMNPTGRSSVAILHEFVQRALKGRISYDINETKSTLPYTAVAKLFLKKEIRVQLVTSIKDKLEILQAKKDEGTGDDEDQLILGTGQGTSKKNAKLVAAEEAVKLLIPSILFDQDHNASLEANGPSQLNYDSKATEIFDSMEITDKRIVDLCNRSTLPKPYSCLTEACNRRPELQGETPQTTSRIIEGRVAEVTMTLKEHQVTAQAHGTKQAKQLAAQKMLKELHPQVSHYGTILRLYANAQERQIRREHTRTRDEVINLQNKGAADQPNQAMLAKLREEMMASPIETDPRFIRTSILTHRSAPPPPPNNYALPYQPGPSIL